MKKICVLVYVVLFLLTCSTLVSADETNNLPLLSNMSEEECISFIKGSNISIPNLYDDELEWGPFVKQAILIFESNPNAGSPYSHYATSEFFKAIGEAVNDYYARNPSSYPAGVYAVTSLVSGLDNSSPYGSWNPAYAFFNCYAFVWGYPQWLEPGSFDYVSEDPAHRTVLEYVGNFSLSGLDIVDIRDLVLDDLEAQNYTDVVWKLNHMSTDNMCTNERIFCVRMGETDYHFMIYADGQWLHKPGNTQVLIYNGTPNLSDIWTNEAIFEGKYIPYTKTYTSDIYFFSVNGHDWEYISQNNGTHMTCCSKCSDINMEACTLEYSGYNSTYHKGTCAYCGYTTGYSPCSYEYSNNITGSHKATCTVCGDSFTENCNLSYSSTGYYTHKESCSICGYTSTNQACSFSYMSNGDQTHAKYCTICDNRLDLGCTMVTTYSGNGAHHSECTVCGGEYDEACTAVKTYCGNATLGDVHALACEACGNSMGTATESCTFEYIFTGTVNGHNVHSRICRDCDYAKVADAQCMYKNGNLCFLCGHPGDLNSGEILKTGEQIE